MDRRNIKRGISFLSRAYTKSVLHLKEIREKITLTNFSNLKIFDPYNVSKSHYLTHYILIYIY